MRSLLITSALLFAAATAPTAFAANHPHDNTATESDKDTDTVKSLPADFASKLEERLSRFETTETDDDASRERSAEKQVKIFKFKSGDEMRRMSKDVEEMIVESGMLSNLADMVANFAEDIEIEKGEKSFSVRFDGDTLGEINHDDDDRVVLKSMDKEMTVEKETYVEDGRTRTRIVIEMDGDGSNIDLDEVLTEK